MALAPVARPDGLGADYARRVTMGRAAVAAIGVAVAAAPVVTLDVRALRGISGEVLGVVEQIAETLVLVACTVLAHRYDLWWSCTGPGRSGRWRTRHPGRCPSRWQWRSVGSGGRDRRPT